MELITGLSIKGFRSIRGQRLDDLAPLSVLIGKNSSGKSNVLRALNLFFNDEVDPGVPINTSEDFHRIEKKKRLIEIAVDFALPSTFKFRTGLKVLEKTLTRQFTIIKRWELGRQLQAVRSSSLEVGGKARTLGEDAAEQFLNLIQYRYVTNRTVPVELLRTESREIARSITARMRSVAGAQTVLNALHSGAKNLLSDAASAMQRSGAPLSSVEMSTARSLAEMLAVSGFQAVGAHGSVVRDEFWGAGTQAYFLFQVLKAVDTTYTRSFGWRQACIWGVEEPESGLHHDLETRLGENLRQWAMDGPSKLQVLMTTHSPIFAMAAERGYWVSLANGASEVRKTPISTLVRDAQLKGVSSFVQPVLAFPANPVVLVEGAIDSEVLSHVAGLAGFRRLRFLSLPELDPAEKGAGKDAITTYLKRHGMLVSNRPTESPLIVTFDWEVPKHEIDAAKKAYGPGADVAVLKMNSAYCHSKMGDDFKGIERFYPPTAVHEAVKAGEFAAAEAASGVLTISQAQLSIAKQRLRNRILQITDLTQLQPILKVIGDIDHAVKSLQGPQLPLPIG